MHGLRAFRISSLSRRSEWAGSVAFGATLLCVAVVAPLASCASTSADDSASPADGSAADATSHDGAIANGDDASALDAHASDGGAAIDAEADASTTSDDAAKGDPYNYAPPSRTVGPVTVLSTQGTVVNPANVLNGQATEIAGNGSYIVLDFGKEVGGLITAKFSAASDASQSVGLAFSESSLYVGPNSDKSNGGSAPDGAIIVPVAGATTYTVPGPLLRGGFRYLTVFLNSSGFVHLDRITLDYAPDPGRAVPNHYPNYFHSNDETLNKAWYAGAYTFQTNIARNGEGRAWPPPGANWDNGHTIGESGTVALVDGAKRDRTVWPGDMAISLPTGYASIFDTEAAKNSLQTMFNHEDASGALPYAGPPLNLTGSDTYHMWTLFGVGLHYVYTGDKAWLDVIWPKYKSAVSYITSKIDANGLLSVTGTADWARDNQGGENIEANAILYGVLVKSADLARIEGDAALASTYASQAAALKTKINGTLWDSSVGAFKDTPTSTLYPQDGNAIAVWFDVVDSPAKARGIYVLNESWNDKGARAPEFTLGGSAPLISTFIGSIELMSHFTSLYDTRALDMIRMTWGFMLNSAEGTKSTFWEGFDSAGHFAYQDSYTSLAHGWGTGPTSALTFYVLGVAPDSAAGQTYHVIPHPGDLTHVEGTLTMAAGKTVSVGYDVGAACKTFTMRVDARSHAGSLGTIGIPRFGADHTIFVDGVVAWDGTKLVPTAGIAGASQTADYVLLNGVSPGARTFAFDDGIACAPPPETWTFCADENGQCTFTGTKRVRFGKRGQYTYAILAGGTACSTSAFVDPIPGVLKSCQFSDELYTFCAAEGGTCAFTGSKEVRFGANGQWVTKTLTGGTACNVTTFGDPIDDVVKRCEIR